MTKVVRGVVTDEGESVKLIYETHPDAEQVVTVLTNGKDEDGFYRKNVLAHLDFDEFKELRAQVNEAWCVINKQKGNESD